MNKEKFKMMFLVVNINKAFSRKYSLTPVEKFEVTQPTKNHVHKFKA